MTTNLAGIFRLILNLIEGFLKKGLGTIPRQDFELLFEVDFQTEVIEIFIINFILQNLGEKLSPEEIEGLLDEADKEGEGFINYAEFCSIKNLV